MSTRQKKIMNLLLIFILCFFVSMLISCSKCPNNYDSSDSKQWTKQWGTADWDFGHGVATDSSGNIYVTGLTNGGLEGNTNAGGEDIFLTKYDSSGVKQWTRQWGTESVESSFDIAIDNFGNIYVVGLTNGGFDGNINKGDSDIFLTKYDSSGSKQWTRQWGTAKDDRGSGVATDGSGNIYITGFTKGGLDGNTNKGGFDIFLTKYNSSGVKQWTKQWGTEDWDWRSDVAIDNSGNIYVTGCTEGGLDGNINEGDFDIFLTKYDSSGSKQWTRQWGTFRDDKASSVATDSSGNIYITGFTRGRVDYNIYTGGEDIFLTKYSSSGVKQWTRQWGTAKDDSASGIATDNSVNIYILGKTEGELDGNNNKGDSDIFLTKYDSSGVKQWTRQWGTENYDIGSGVATDGSGNIYVTGFTEGGLDGNTNKGGFDIFLTKWHKNGIILDK